jgi:hypothetical protein
MKGGEKRADVTTLVLEIVWRAEESKAESGEKSRQKSGRGRAKESIKEFTCKTALFASSSFWTAFAAIRHTRHARHTRHTRDKRNT